MRINYDQFAKQVTSLTKALLAQGLKKGDRVAFLGMPRPEYMIVMMSVVDIGAIWMGMHPRYKLNEFRHVVSLAQPKFIFAFSEIEGRHYNEELNILLNEYHEVENLIVFDDRPKSGISFQAFLQFESTISETQLQQAKNLVDPDDSAVIIFTSGTTGKPKGAMNSHFGLVHCAQIELSRWPDPDMRVLQNMPINHIANIGMMSSCALVAGGTLVFQDRFDPQDLLKIIEKEKISFWLQSPVQFHLVATHPDFDQADLSSLRYMIWGGGPMPQHLVEKLFKLDATLATAYGMTELTAYASYSDLDASAETLSDTIGKPEPRYDLRLQTEKGTLAGVAERGEIQARGRWLMNGYFNQPEETKLAFTDDGWFKTGDVAELLTDGSWRLVGRLKEMYKSGGYNIYPREIEIAIEEHPGVALTAVLGVPHEVFNEVGYAFVQPLAGVDISVDEIMAWCKERLANYKVPKEFEIINELPRLPIGKIDKQLLRERLLYKNSGSC